MRHEAVYTLSPAPRRLRRFGIIVLTPIAGLVAIGAVRAWKADRPFSPPPPAVQAFSVPRLADPIPGSDVATADALLADVYPSKQSAVRALARRLPDAIATVAEKPSKFRLNVEPNSTPGAMVSTGL